MKRLGCVSLMAVAMFSPLFAGVCTPCSGDSCKDKNGVSNPSMASAVYVKSPDYSYEVFFTPMGLQPITNNLDYAADAHFLPADSPHWNSESIDTSLGFAFNLGAAWICHDNHNTVRANWEYFHSNDTSSLVVDPTDQMVGPFFEIGPDAQFYNQGIGHVMFNFNSWDINYGLYTKSANMLRTNLFVGVNSIYLKQNRDTTYINQTGAISRVITSPTKYLGFGPQIGLDFSYKIRGDFRLNGAGVASLLVGPQMSGTTYQSYAPGIAVPPNTQSISTPRRVQLVPGFELKLGLAYDYRFAKDSVLSVEAGYNTEVYVNAIQSVDLSSEVIDVGLAPSATGVFARTLHRTLSNFALAGPYGTVTVGF